MIIIKPVRIKKLPPNHQISNNKNTEIIKNDVKRLTVKVTALIVSFPVSIKPHYSYRHRKTYHAIMFSFCQPSNKKGCASASACGTVYYTVL